MPSEETHTLYNLTKAMEVLNEFVEFVDKPGEHWAEQELDEQWLDDWLSRVRKIVEGDHAEASADLLGSAVASEEQA